MKYEIITGQNQTFKFKHFDSNAMHENHHLPVYNKRVNSMQAYLLQTKLYHLPAAVHVRNNSHVRGKWLSVARIHDVIAVLRDTAPAWTLADNWTTINISLHFSSSKRQTFIQCKSGRRRQRCERASEWASSFFTAHQHIKGHFSAIKRC